MSSPQHRQTWEEFLNGWRLAATVTVILCLLAVFAIQTTTLLMTERFRFAALFLLVVCICIARDRRLLVPVKRCRTIAQRFIWFPGYLLTIGLVALVAGIGMASLPVVTLGCVYGFGWFLAKKCDVAHWPRLVQPWILLHLFCVSNQFEWVRNSPLPSIASTQLDAWSILHRMEGTRLLLVDQASEIGLDPNVVLSDYAIVGLTLCILAVIRCPALLMILAMTVAILVGHTLVAQRVLLGGLVSYFDWTIDVSKLDFAIQGVAFLFSASIIASVSSLFWFALNPITYRLNNPKRGGRLAGMWDRVIGVQLSELMTGRDACLQRACITVEPMNLGSFKRFLSEYFRSRSFPLLIGAVPSCVLLLCVSTMSGNFTDRNNRAQIAKIYESAFSSAIARSDFDRAQLLLDRLRELSYDLTSYELRMASTKLLAGKTDEGVALVKELIRRRPENIPAQLWLARYHLSLSTYDLGQSTVLLDKLAGSSSLAAMNHLKIVVESGHASSETIAIYAILLCQNGQSVRAARTLASAQDDDACSALKLAKLQHHLGFHDDAVVRAKCLIRSQPITNENNLTSGDAIVFAEVFTLTGQYREAAQLLEQTLYRYPQDEKIAAGLMQVWLRIASDTEILKGAPNVQEARLSLLKKMEQLDRLNGDFQCLLARFALASDPDIDPNLRHYCQDTLKQAIDADEVQPEALVILGTGAARDDKMSAAKLYLLKAYDCGNRSPALLNNLAWVLSQGESADLYQALAIADQAIAADARSKETRLTRADILVRVGRFTDAIVDLERVDQEQGDRSEIASRMAICYEALGDDELASQFRNLAHQPVP